MGIVVVSPESRFAGSRFARTKVNSPDDKQHSTTRLYIRDAVSEALILLLRLLKKVQRSERS